MKTVGFIGIGNMGRPMAANLIKGGFDVVAYDADAQRAAAFAREAGAKSASSLGELGKSVDAIVTMLPTGKEVRACLLETEGGALAANLRKGAIVIDMSSADPVGTRKTHADLAKRGIAFVDSPVSGGVPRATDGTLAIMIGGDPAAVAAARPVLEKMGTRLFDVGGPGNGHAMKALNNFVAGTGFIAVAEAVLVGKRFGLDPNVMIDIMNVSTGKNFNTENVVKQHVISGAFASGFALGLLAKDVKIAADLAQAIDVESPLTRLSASLLEEARDEVGFAKDHTLAYTFWERRDKKAAAE
ncbi:MAG: NAD(P)-dependent oxidoreductase [Alphaproteobacteria bacterium]|nr:NAD(P)-dependent oxidoreductase [Alphaproteobacteria bacterium]